MVAVIGSLAALAFSAARVRVRRVRPRAAVRPKRLRPVVKPAKPVVRRKLARVKPVVYRRTVEGRVVVVQPAGGGNQGGQTDTEDGQGEQDVPVVAEVTPADTDDELAQHSSYEVVSVDGEALTAVVKVDGEDVPVRMIGVAPLELQQDEQTSNAPARPGPAGRPNITGLFLKNLLEGESVYVVYDAQVEEEDEDATWSPTCTAPRTACWLTWRSFVRDSRRRTPATALTTRRASPTINSRRRNTGRACGVGSAVASKARAASRAAPNSRPPPRHGARPSGA